MMHEKKQIFVNILGTQRMILKITMIRQGKQQLLKNTFGNGKKAMINLQNMTMMFLIKLKVLKLINLYI